MSGLNYMSAEPTPPRIEPARIPCGLAAGSGSFAAKKVPSGGFRNSERPQDATFRTSVGHWETDTAVSRQSKVALQITVERKTRYTRIAKLPNKTAHAMRVALTRRLSRVPADMRKTIAYDNGTENTDHETTNRILGTQSYFCEPYHSWEKGTVENTIGLVRRFLPKKTDFAIVSSKDIRTIERWLNNRPRKCLNFNTPAEAMKAERVALAG